MVRLFLTRPKAIDETTSSHRSRQHDLRNANPEADEWRRTPVHS